MNPMLKSLALGSALAVAAVQPAIAQNRAAAQASSAPIVPGLAVADFDAILVNTDANRAAAQQRQTTYKAQFDAYEARRKQLADQLKPLVDRFEADR